MINQIAKEIEEKTQNNYKHFLKSVKDDALRVHRCEIKIKKFEEVYTKIDAINTSIEQLMITDGEFQGVKLFVERQMPMLTHLQLCEGLNAIVGENIESLQNFEKSKMLQIAAF